VDLTVAFIQLSQKGLSLQGKTLPAYVSYYNKPIGMMTVTY